MKKTFATVAAVLLIQASPAFSQDMPFVDDFNDGVLSESRYRVRTNNDNSSIIVDNGMLRLETNSDSTMAGRASLDLVGQFDFIQAELKLDSTSMAEGTGMSRVMLAGTLYNDRRPGGVEDGGSLGDVLIQLSLRLKGDGTLDNLICAFRSDDADFGNITTIVIDGFTECARFDTDIQLGVPYTASIFLDRAERKLVFTLDGSTIEHVIRGNIFEPTSRAVSSVLVRSEGIGRTVAFADNLSNSIDAVAEDDSTTDDTTGDTTDGTTDDTTGDTTDDTTGDTTDDTTDDTTGDTTDGTTGDTTDATTDDTSDGSASDVPADDASLDSITGSGCSIGGTSASNDPMLWILAALALLVPGLRRTPLRRLLPASKMTEGTAITA